MLMDINGYYIDILYGLSPFCYDKKNAAARIQRSNFLASTLSILSPKGSGKSLRYRCGMGWGHHSNFYRAIKIWVHLTIYQHSISTYSLQHTFKKTVQHYSEM